MQTTKYCFMGSCSSKMETSLKTFIKMKLKKSDEHTKTNYDQNIRVSTLSTFYLSVSGTSYRVCSRKDNSNIPR